MLSLKFSRLNGTQLNDFVDNKVALKRDAEETGVEIDPKDRCWIGVQRIITLVFRHDC